jgi:16S rRNA (guanine527-N7)-methyltransferase
VDDMFELPRDAVESLVGRLTDAQADSLSDYVKMLLCADRRTNLVSEGDRSKLGEHVVDCAALLKALEVGDSLADLGSGGGLPGLVVAIARPETRVTLVEARRSKVVFLKQAVRGLSLQNASVVHARLESLPGGRQYAVTASRALGSVERTLAASLQVTARDGRLVLFKGPGWQREKEAALRIAATTGAELESEIEVELPGMGRTTTFVVFHVKPAPVGST